MIALFIGINANAQWQLQTNGIYSSAQFQSITSSGNNICAGLNSAIFYSSNSGASWSDISTYTMSGSDFYSLLFFDNYFFAGSNYGLWYTGSIGSQWWHKYYSGMPNGTEIYSMTTLDYNLYVGTQYGIYYSPDYGSSFISCPNFNGYSVYSLITKGSYLFAGGELGAYVSNDYGSTWSQKSNGLPQSGVGTIVLSFAVIGNFIFAGTDGAGVFVSNNNGSSWSCVSNGLSNLYINSILINGTTIYACTNDGIYISTNNGSSWSNYGLTNKQVKGLTLNGTNIFAATNSGVWKRSLFYQIEDYTGFKNCSVYPNPTTDKITIETDDIKNMQNTIISIFDIQGKLLSQQTLNPAKTEVTLSDFSQGIYLLKLENSSGIAIRKITKE